MMKRNSIFYRGAVLALSLVTALSSCGSLTTQAAVQQFDGKSLYLGIFFGEGEVGKRLPEVWSGKSTTERSNPDLVQEVKRTEARILDRLEQADSTFFSRFQQEVSSGNPLRVEAVLNDGAKRLKDVLKVKTREGINPELGAESWFVENKNVAVDSNVVFASDVVQASEVAVFMLAVVAIAGIAVIVVVFGASDSSDARGKTSALQHDVFVNLMTTRFATVP
jgi:SdpC family antimicrobial peptide